MIIQMAVARKESFPFKQNDLADFAKTLGHPARLEILKILAEKRECICGEIVLDIPLAQSTVSQHLKALKELGLIKGTIDGPRSRYCIDWKVFDRYQKLMGNWFQSISTLRLDNCC